MDADLRNFQTNLVKKRTNPTPKTKYLNLRYDRVSRSKSEMNMTISPQSKPKILIIDDDPSYTSVLRVMLERENYPVLSMDGAVPKLEEYIEQHQIKLLLLDRVMPAPDGLAVLEKLRKTFSKSQLPIILTSASESIPDIEQAEKLGVNSYIFKLLPPKELLSELQNCLDNPGAS